MEVAKRKFPSESLSPPAQAGRGLQAKDADKLQAKGFHRKIKVNERSQAKVPQNESFQAQASERKFPNASSKATVPKRKFPNEGSQTKAIKRNFPSERSQATISNRNFRSGRSQTEVLKRESPSRPAKAGQGFQAKDPESVQANDPRRLQAKDPHRKIQAAKSRWKNQLAGAGGYTFLRRSRFQGKDPRRTF